MSRRARSARSAHSARLNIGAPMAPMSERLGLVLGTMISKPDRVCRSTTSVTTKTAGEKIYSYVLDHCFLNEVEKIASGRKRREGASEAGVERCSPLGGDAHLEFFAGVYLVPTMLSRVTPVDF